MKIPEINIPIKKQIFISIPRVTANKKGRHLTKQSRMLLWPAIIVALAVLLAGCGSGSDNAVTATVIKGKVTDNTGAPLAGVAVTVGTDTTNSIADGTYSLTVTPGANLKVTAAKAGLVDTFKVVTLAAGQTMPLDFMLLAVGKSNTLTNMDTTPTVADSGRGATVSLPAGSIVIEGTNIGVTDAVVEVTNAMPSDTNYTANFPGSFVGAKSGADVAIESFGYVTINITSGGQKCNLGAGKTATIDIPVDAGADPGTATIDLWSLDEATGKWIYEGVATRVAGPPVVYRGTVTHFSAYNLDRAIENAIPFVVTVENAAGTKVSGAGVVISATNEIGGGKWEGRGVTDANGIVRFPEVPPGTVTVTATSGNQSGNAYGYDIVGGEGVLTITLHATVQKTFTLVYDDNGVEKPAANIDFEIMGEGGAGHNFMRGTTDADGVVTLNLVEGLSFYNYWAHIAVGGVTYSANGNVSVVADLPSKIVLTEQSE
jgi:hypothetical protein